MSNLSLENFSLAVLVHLNVHSHVISMTSVAMNKAQNTLCKMQTSVIHLSNSKNAEKTSLKDTENM